MNAPNGPGLLRFCIIRSFGVLPAVAEMENVFHFRLDFFPMIYGK
jgi:hypothetical protein